MLLGVTKKDRLTLAKHVLNSNGTLILLVHPFFDVTSSPRCNTVVGGIIGRRKNLAILEQHGSAEELRRDLKLLKRPCIVIPTPGACGIPLLKGGQHDDGHSNLYKFAKSVGANTVILGGMNLTERGIGPDNAFVEKYERDWLQKRDRKVNPHAERKPSKMANDGGCVGCVYNGLIRNALSDKDVPINVRLMPGASYNPPSYSRERNRLHNYFK